MLLEQIWKICGRLLRLERSLGELVTMTPGVGVVVATYKTEDDKMQQ